MNIAEKVFIANTKINIKLIYTRIKSSLFTNFMKAIKYEFSLNIDGSITNDTYGIINPTPKTSKNEENIKIRIRIGNLFFLAPNKNNIFFNNIGSSNNFLSKGDIIK